MRYPLRYDPLYWGAVFPLGMYAACTHAMAGALNLRFLAFLPAIVAYVAVGAWSLAFAGMVVDVGKRVVHRGNGLPA